MPIVAEQYAYVIGVDTHARSHTFAVVTAATAARGPVAGFPATPAGLARAVSWGARRTGDPAGVLVVIEGIGSYGAHAARAFTAAGYPVAEAEDAPAARRRGKGKSDPLDAAAIAVSVLGTDVDRLRVPRADGARNALRILANAREAMTTDKTATINALTALVRTQPLDVDARASLTTAQIRTIAAWRPRPDEPVDVAVARAEATRLACRVLDLAHHIAANHAQLRDLVADLDPGLAATPGIGPVVAAAVLIAWSHPGRIRDEASFAALAGVSPLPASSGNTTRHRLNRTGDRRLNRALHTIALTRMRHDTATRAYVTRRLSEGKTKREIIRCLKRYIARQIYRQLAATTPTLDLVAAA